MVNLTTNVFTEVYLLRKELLNLKISLSSGQLKETHKIKEIRKSIAQLKTIQKETLKEQINDG